MNSTDYANTEDPEVSANQPQASTSHQLVTATTMPLPVFTITDSNEYTQITRSSPVVVPVPMPRSVSFRKLQPNFKSKACNDTDVFHPPDTKEQRSMKRRSQSMDDIFNSKMKTFGKFLETPPVPKVSVLLYLFMSCTVNRLNLLSHTVSLLLIRFLNFE